MSSSRLIICGLGYTGRAIDRAWRSAPNNKVIATARSHDSAAENEEPGRTMVRVDFSEGELPVLSGLDGTAGVLTFGTTGQSDPAFAVERAVRWLADAGCECAVYLSSTSVYGTGDGSWVTEQSETSPQTDMGRKRLIAEQSFLATANSLGVRGVILRLPGIYGPGRTPKPRFLSGAYRFPTGVRWSNRIYRNDVAEAVVHMATSDEAGVFNTSDGHPFQASEFASWCAAELGVASPSPVPFDELSERAKPFWLANRRVSNAKLLATGWAPAVADYQTGHRLAWRAEDEPG